MKLWDNEFLSDEKSDLPYQLEEADTKKTAIVTGGSQGIGAGLVKALLDSGYNALVCEFMRRGR